MAAMRLLGCRAGGPDIEVGGGMTDVESLDTRRGGEATAEAGASSVQVDELVAWLMERALKGADIEALLAGAFDRVKALGIPIERANVGMTTLHPLFESLTFTWTPQEGLTSERFAHGMGTSSEVWQRSPYAWLIRRRLPFMRRRLAGAHPMLDFPLLEDFAGAGYTDYLAWLNAFDAAKDDGVVSSVMTRRPDGFTDAEIAQLGRIKGALAVALKVLMREQLAENVLSAYLGEAAAARVLDGQIRRGDGERIEAAIWYSDLRGSTELAGEGAPEAFLETLDAYFEATAGAVMAEGGQVLLLIGDAVLAIFPVGGDGRDAACARAVAAARRAFAEVERLNETRSASRSPLLRFGLGMHVGELLFGNIGTPERLQFTAVGPAVNCAARLEELSKRLDRPAIASGAFAERVVDATWSDLGAHGLRGLAQPLSVAALEGL
jgi:adenylate cyclase